MKIFYFPSFYPSERPGEKWLGAFTHRQVKALQGLGVDIEVINPIAGYPIWPFYLLFRTWRVNKAAAHKAERVYEGVKIFHPRIPSPRPSRFFKAYSYYYKKAVSSFLKKRIKNSEDTYLFAQWLPEAGMVVKIGKELGVRTAVLGIGDDVIKVPYQSDKHLIGFKECWKNADLRGVVADYLGKAANSIMGEVLPYEVFYSSVNIDEFFPASESQRKTLRQSYKLDINRTIILCVGSPIIRKGWLDLFDALAGIDAPEFLLLGVNGGKKELNLIEEAKKRGLEDRFIDIGEVPAHKIGDYYQLADIFCLPSHWEGLANALLEAMATGLPVITTNVSGHPEVVRDGDNGFMINVGDVEALREKIRFLLNDKALRLTMGQKAHLSVKEVPGSHLQTAEKIIKKLQSC